MLDKLASLTPPIESVLDLLGDYPRRYHDRTNQSDIADLAVGEEATIVGEVASISSCHAPTQDDGRGRGQGRGRLINLVFFNQPWRAKQLTEGTEVALTGSWTSTAASASSRTRSSTSSVVPVRRRA